MGRVRYAGLVSLDGYLVDADGNSDWAAPDEEVHAFVNEQERPVGTYLYGRRMYEVMQYWETALEQPDTPAVEQEYARVWQAADKIVYSSTLAAPVTARTRLERRFDVGAVRALKDRSSTDLSVGGAELAAQALQAGLVDEIGVYVAPVVVGGGTRLLPDGLRIALGLLEEHRFASGFVYLRYAVRGDEVRRAEGDAVGKVVVTIS